MYAQRKTSTQTKIQTGNAVGGCFKVSVRGCLFARIVSLTWLAAASQHNPAQAILTLTSRRWRGVQGAEGPVLDEESRFPMAQLGLLGDSLWALMSLATESCRDFGRCKRPVSTKDIAADQVKLRDREEGWMERMDGRMGGRNGGLDEQQQQQQQQRRFVVCARAEGAGWGFWILGG